MFSLLAQAQVPEITNPAINPTFGAQPPAIALTAIIVTVWRTAITLGGLALLVMLIIGALGWITAGGDKGKIEASRERIVQSVIGMLVLVGTVAISLFIGGILGIELLSPSFEDNINAGGAINGGINNYQQGGQQNYPGAGNLQNGANLPGFNPNY